MSSEEMKEELIEEKSIATMVYVALGGVVAGAILGLLFAPKPGVEFRADLNEFGKNTAEKGQRLYSRVKSWIPSKQEAENVLREGTRQATGSFVSH